MYRHIVVLGANHMRAVDAGRWDAGMPGKIKVIVQEITSVGHGGIH
jgi:hypothetical protein